MNDFTAADLHISAFAVFVTDNAGENEIIPVSIDEAATQDAARALVESALDAGWMVALIVEVVDNITITA